MSSWRFTARCRRGTPLHQATRRQEPHLDRERRHFGISTPQPVSTLGCQPHLQRHVLGDDNNNDNDNADGRNGNDDLAEAKTAEAQIDAPATATATANIESNNDNNNDTAATAETETETEVVTVVVTAREIEKEVVPTGGIEAVVSASL